MTDIKRVPAARDMLIGMDLTFLGAAREVTGSCHLVQTGSASFLLDHGMLRARIHTIGGLSAHADRDGLLGWLRKFRRPPAQTYVVHAEAATALGFAETIRNELGWKAEAPAPGARVTVNASH